jgi:hypothetical protein
MTPLTAKTSEPDFFLDAHQRASHHPRPSAKNIKLIKPAPAAVNRYFKNSIAVQKNKPAPGKNCRAVFREQHGASAGLAGPTHITSQ